jgi:AbiV family abortive infection protein
MAPGEEVEPEKLKKSLDDHEEKLKAGQTSVQVPMGEAWLEEWHVAIAANDSEKLTKLQPQYDLAVRAIRKREPQDTHLRRMRAQYVDPQPDGSWSDPSTVTTEDTRMALMSVAAGVANTLIGLRSNHLLSKMKDEIPPPNMGDFTTRVFSKIAARGV